jgi:hypothetical protein
MFLVETDRPGAFYLVDPATRRCWFQEGGHSRGVDCARVPEAAQLLGEQRAALETRAPAAEPTRRPLTARAPEPVVAPGAPAPRPEVVERLPAAPRHVPAVKPDSAAPRRDLDLGPVPSAQEKRAFTLAYIAVYCDRREGGQADPASLIAAQGLSLQRYGEIEGWQASDPVAWRNLQAAAASACSAAGGGGTPPDTD